MLTIPSDKGRVPLTRLRILLTNENGATKPTAATIILSKIPWTGQRLYAPLMATDTPALQPKNLSNLGRRGWYENHKLGLVTFKLGLTTTQNNDIVNPRSGAGIIADVLDINPYISKTNPGSQFYRRLIDHLEGHDRRSEAFTDPLLRQMWRQLQCSEVLENDYNRFPVPMIITQQRYSGTKWTADAVMYNVLDLPHCMRIPNTPDNAYVDMLLRHVIQQPIPSYDGMTGEVIRRPSSKTFYDGGTDQWIDVSKSSRFGVRETYGQLHGIAGRDSAKNYRSDDMRSTDSGESVTGPPHPYAHLT